MSVDRSARHVTDDALGLFAEVFGEFARQQLSTAYGPDWYARRFAAVGLGQRSRSDKDPSDLLGMLETTSEFDKAFRHACQLAPRSIAALAREAREQRNTFAHWLKEWDASDALRLVDRLAQVLACFGLLIGDTSDRMTALQGVAAAAVAALAGPIVEGLRPAYIESVLTATAYADLAGISSHVGPRIVKVRLEDVYIEPSLSQAEPAAASGIGIPDLLLRNRAVVIAGPGAGKSTLVRQAARRLALRTDDRLPRRTPIIVRAPDYGIALIGDPALSLRRFIGSRMTERFGSLLLADLDAGRAAVFVDALDEVAEESVRTRMSAAIGDFAAEYSDIPIIATTRPVGFRAPSSWSAFDQVAIEPLDEARIERFVNAWLSVLGEAGDRPDGILKAIAGSTSLQELAGTPLLLTILVLLWRRGGNLPTRRVDLYEKATLTLLGDWPSHRLGRRIDERRYLQLLQPIARLLVATGTATVDEPDVASSWATILADTEGLDDAAAAARADELLQVIQEHTGFFVEVGYAGGVRQYGFVHRSFTEYLAARDLADDWDRGELDLDAYLTSPTWSEVLGLFAMHVGMRGVPAASRLIERIALPEHGPWAPLHRTLLLAARLIGDGVEVDRATRDGIVNRLLAAFFDPVSDAMFPSIGEALRAMSRDHERKVLVDRLADLGSKDPTAAGKRAWLRVLIAPSDEALCALMTVWRPLLDSGDNEYPVVDVVIDAVGAVEIDLDEVPASEWGEALLFLEEAHTLDAGVEERLIGLGVQHVTLVEYARGEGPRLSGLDLWLCSLRDADDLTLQDFLALAARGDVGWLTTLLATLPDWHASKVDQIIDLAAAPEQLPAAVGPAALRFVVAPDMDNAAGEAWFTVLGAVFQGGTVAARQSVFSYLARHTVLETLPPSVALSLVSGDDWDAAGVGVLTTMLGSHDLPGWADLRVIADGLVRDHPDPAIRGMARLGLVLSQAADKPIWSLASPDVVSALQHEAVGDVIGAGTALIQYLISLPRDDDERRVATRILGDVIKAIPCRNPWFSWRRLRANRRDRRTWADSIEEISSTLISNSDVESLVREAASSDDPNERAWAGSILGLLKRDPAQTEIAAMLADPERVVRLGGINALGPSDLLSTEWLAEVLPDFLRLSQAWESRNMGELIADMAPPRTITDLAELCSALVDDDTLRPGPLRLLQALSVRAG